MPAPPPLLLIGWKAALRTDDLARLDITDVMVPEEGLTVHLRRSKTDQAGAGDAVGITATDPDDPPRRGGGVDPVAQPAGLPHGLHTGPAWRGIDRYGRRPAPPD